MIEITKRFFLISPLIALATRAFGQPTPEAGAQVTADNAALAHVAASAIDGYILPAYTALKTATAAMAAAIEASCTAPTAEPTPAVRAAFEAVLIAWANVDFLRFGPIAEKGRHERFSFLPDPHGTGTRQLRKILAQPDPALLEPGAVARLSAAVQGLPALEGLLYAGASQSETLAYRCQLAARIAENLNAIATETLEGWTGPEGWKHLMQNPGGDNIVYRDAAEPVVEILKAIGVGLLQLRDQRLLPALGKSFETAKPNRGVFVKSGLTLVYLEASGKAIGRLVEASDLFSLTPAVAGELKADNDKGLAEFAAALDVGTNWTEALGTQAGYDRLRHGFDMLRPLEDIYNYRFPVAANISPGFNALDGD